jgi:hypothetical protein
MILSGLLRKKLTENQVANIFINGMFDSIDKGFDLVVGVINDDTAFISAPSIREQEIHEFALVIITGNIIEIERQFEGHLSERILKLVYEKLAQMYKMETMEMHALIKEYKSYMNRVNIPSKTTIYAMSKAIFHKYGLNVYQDDYFKRMNTPNPIFLKRLDELMVNFLWNWDAFFKKYRL